MTKVPASIYAEQTPNPATMKFVANMMFTENSRYEFTTVEEAEASPIAAKLFRFPFVKNVFIMSNFISVTINDMVTWDDVTLELREFILEHLRNGEAVLSEEAIAAEETQTEATAPSMTGHSEAQNDDESQIISILDEYVKPGVEQDGGHIAFQKFEEGTVHVLLQGACSGCPSSTMTLKAGIEGLLKHQMPEKVKEVVAVNG